MAAPIDVYIFTMTMINLSLRVSRIYLPLWSLSLALMFVVESTKAACLGIVSRVRCPTLQK